MRRFELTDEQYARIEHLLPGKLTDPGATARDNRLFMDAILWIARTGAPSPARRSFGGGRSHIPPAMMPSGSVAR